MRMRQSGLNLIIDASASMKGLYVEQINSELYELSLLNVQNPYFLEIADEINVITYGDDADTHIISRNELNKLQIHYRQTNVKNLGKALALRKDGLSLILTNGNPSDEIKEEDRRTIKTIVIAFGHYINPNSYFPLTPLITTSVNNALKIIERWFVWMPSAFAGDTIDTFVMDCRQDISSLLYK